MAGGLSIRASDRQEPFHRGNLKAACAASPNAKAPRSVFVAPVLAGDAHGTVLPEPNAADPGPGRDRSISPLIANVSVST